MVRVIGSGMSGMVVVVAVVVVLVVEEKRGREGGVGPWSLLLAFSVSVISNCVSSSSSSSDSDNDSWRCRFSSNEMSGLSSAWSPGIVSISWLFNALSSFVSVLC